MQISKVENLVEKIVLVFLILWGAASFFIFPNLPIFGWAFLLVSLFTVYLAISSRSSYFVLISITFSSAYFFYGLQSAYGLPLWSILIGLGFFLSLAFWFLGQQLVPSVENFSLVLTFFLISMLELYLTLSFWLINPLTKSLIMSVFSYLFAGYLANITDKNKIDRRFSTYIYTTIFVLAVLIFTVSWGR